MMTNNRSAGKYPRNGTGSHGVNCLDTVAAQEPQRCEAIRRRIEQKICFVLRREGKIAGYGVLHYHFKSSLWNYQLMHRMQPVNRVLMR